MRRVALATGVELAVHEYGAGVPVLLLHAWGETHRVFDRLVGLLPRSLHLVVPDQRGVGASTKPQGGYSLRDAAADVVALLDALSIEDCWLLGTSSGGYLAQQVAVDHPERVCGLVLAGAPSDLQGPAPPSFAAFVAAAREAVTREEVEALTASLPLHAPVPSGFVEDQTTAALSIPRRVWRASLEGLVAAAPPTQTGWVTAPTLILWGAEEDVLPAEQAHQLAEAIPDSRLVLYEGTGHLVLWEHPERVAADAAAFVAGLR